MSETLRSGTNVRNTLNPASSIPSLSQAPSCIASLNGYLRRDMNACKSGAVEPLKAANTQKRLVEEDLRYNVEGTSITYTPGLLY